MPDIYFVLNLLSPFCFYMAQYKRGRSQSWFHVQMDVGTCSCVLMVGGPLLSELGSSVIYQQGVGMICRYHESTAGRLNEKRNAE